MSGKRRYVMRDRAEARDATRLKIVEAAMQLHEEVGPRETTISAIAERAGVQRLTVYRHFPSEFEVFQACTAHWITLNPLPDPAEWADIEDPLERAMSAVASIYDYFSRTKRMWTAAFRDVDGVPALQGPMAGVAAYADDVCSDLTAAFRFRGRARERLGITVRHVLHFPTWAHLDGMGIDSSKKLAVVRSWIEGSRSG